MLTQPFESNFFGTVQSRVAMAAMTRGFCGPNHTATEEMANYYALRARNGVGLILTEGTIIHKSADGYNNVPHIETEEQAESWSKVVSRVHDEGGKIFCQLWHCGRISHSDYTGGLPPLSSTSQTAEGINRQNNKPFGQPRAMSIEDIEIVRNQFLNAAQNAIRAGFDGIQIHQGHGYLVDQFYDSRINDRTDSYGNSIENRCRFGIELAEDAISVIGVDKVMIRISPSRFMGDVYDWPDLQQMLDHLIPCLIAKGLRMLDISCANADYYKTSGRIIRLVRKIWPYFLIGGASLTRDQGESELQDGYLDMVTWGRALIANPDLVTKFKCNDDIASFDREMLGSLL